MRILLTGPTGQVGSALLETLPSLGEVVAFDRVRLDLSNETSIRGALRDVRPAVIVNAAAYTAVDRAEGEEAAAVSVNAEGPAILAEEAARLGALLVHFSTDYVFDGEKLGPYKEDDPPNPLNVYGRSKLAGEVAVAAARCRYAILRTSWVYASSGRNFLRTILASARQQKPLRVVDDQLGAPTSNLMIAAAVPALIRRLMTNASLDGIYHMTASGQTTWYGFARAIFEATGMGVALTAVSSNDYTAAARRPRNSVLDNGKLSAGLGIRLPPWKVGMHAVLDLAARCN